ncbi:L-arabinose ABC transporter [Campylobacter concisus]|uniref:L-arabinose ABC transporter n=1 Tax=Campylobacter concisus TaxID=199 RepID=A0A7S9NG12_9BACT|nr:L-arabinose ABC transporter [Campylobacter concisus]QPH85105.1 L-arabinose ABC transporter [Campylobacter concisus]
MCCFGTRIFLLMLITVLSFVFARVCPVLPVVGYYLILANLLSILMFLLFFKGLLPSFVKVNAIHYFSLIGGFLGAFLTMLVFKKVAKDKFTLIELIIFMLWILIIAVVIFKFQVILDIFRGI